MAVVGSHDIPREPGLFIRRKTIERSQKCGVTALAHFLHSESVITMGIRERDQRIVYVGGQKFRGDCNGSRELPTQPLIHSGQREHVSREFAVA